VTAKKRDVKFYLLFRAVNQYPDAYYCASMPFHCRHNLVYGAAGGENVVHDEDSLAGVDAEAPPESPLFFAFLFSKYSPHA
jgi:hypothetical protein